MVLQDLMFKANKDTMKRKHLRSWHLFNSPHVWHTWEWNNIVKPVFFILYEFLNMTNLPFIVQFDQNIWGPTQSHILQNIYHMYCVLIFITKWSIKLQKYDLMYSFNYQLPHKIYIIIIHLFLYIIHINYT